jgi:hypothetical protein
VVAAPSFLLSLLLVTPLAGQQLRPELRVAVLSSSTLLVDLLATPALRARLGPGLGASPSAVVALAPEFSVGAGVPLNQRVRLAGLVGWQPTRIEAEDGSGTRDVHGVSVIHALLEAEFALSGPAFLSSGVGALGYRGGYHGLFAEGSDITPLLRLGAGARWAVAGQAVTFRALGDVHRFATPLLRSAGGSGGGVLRYGLQLGVVPGGAR